MYISSALFFCFWLMDKKYRVAVNLLKFTTFCFLYRCKCLFLRSYSNVNMLQKGPISKLIIFTKCQYSILLIIRLCNFVTFFTFLYISEGEYEC